MIRKKLHDIRTMRALLAEAEAEADRRNAELPGVTHLVLAALSLPDGSARRAFDRAGADPDRFRSAVAGDGAERAESDGTPPPRRGPVRTSREAQELFKRVAALVRKEHSQLYGAYVVLVAAEVGDADMTHALDDVGVPAADLAGAARDELDELNA